MIFETIAAFQAHFLWALIVGGCLAFVLGFSMGANDVSNAFGTSVGSKVLSLRMAYILASIFETLGAILVGYNVTDAMRKSIVDINLYTNEPEALLLGQIAILGGASIWLLLATVFKAPVSTTHSVVGATLGFTLLLKGTAGIQWPKIISIACSWVISPLLSGFVSSLLYILVDFSVLRKTNPIKAGLATLPFIYFFVIAFNTFAVSYQGSKVLHLSSVPLWLAFALSFVFGLAAGLIFHFIVSPRLVKWIEGEGHARVADQTQPQAVSVILEDNNNKINNGVSVHSDAQKHVEFVESNSPTPIKQRFSASPKGFIRWFLPARERQIDEKTLRMFSAIQVFTACFAGFAHGANDVSNAIAPLTALVAIYDKMSVSQDEPTPIPILLYGVLATCIGLWILGHRVIKTVGERMSEINPASGFTIEFGAAMTALVASKFGLPISTTHCLVGSVVAVGSVKSGKGVDWTIFRNIALSWVVTLPVSAAISAAIMLVLKWTAL